MGDIVKIDGKPAEVLDAAGNVTAEVALQQEVTKALADSQLRQLLLSAISLWRGYALVRMFIDADPRFSLEVKAAVIRGMMSSVVDDQGAPIPFDDNRVVSDLRLKVLPLLAKAIKRRNDNELAAQAERVRSDKALRKKPLNTTDFLLGIPGFETIERGCLGLVQAAPESQRHVAMEITRRCVGDGLRAALLAPVTQQGEADTISEAMGKKDAICFDAAVPFLGVGPAQSPVRAACRWLDVVVVDMSGMPAGSFTPESAEAQAEGAPWLSSVLKSEANLARQSRTLVILVGSEFPEVQVARGRVLRANYVYVENGALVFKQ